MNLNICYNINLTENIYVCTLDNGIELAIFKFN